MTYLHYWSVSCWGDCSYHVGVRASVGHGGPADETSADEGCAGCGAERAGSPGSSPRPLVGMASSHQAHHPSSSVPVESKDTRGSQHRLNSPKRIKLLTPTQFPLLSLLASDLPFTAFLLKISPVPLSSYSMTTSQSCICCSDLRGQPPLTSTCEDTACGLLDVTTWDTEMVLRLWAFSEILLGT